MHATMDVTRVAAPATSYPKCSHLQKLSSHQMWSMADEHPADLRVCKRSIVYQTPQHILSAVGTSKSTNVRTLVGAARSIDCCITSLGRADLQEEKDFAADS